MHLSRWHPHPHHSPASSSPGTDAGHKAPRLGLTLIAASLSIMLVELDFFALNLALPDMAKELDTTTTDLQLSLIHI